MKERQTLPGWRLSKEEIRAGYYRFTLTDADGNNTQTKGPDTAETLDDCAALAFEIEQKKKLNWNEFLFNFCVNRLIQNNVLHTQFSNNSDGSWYLESTKTRLKLDGESNKLLYQVRSSDRWKTEQSLSTELLTLDLLNSFIGQFKN